MPNKARNELMGGKGAKADLSLEDLPELLGERCPKIEHTRVGRLRLLTALRSRFGDNYTHLPGISNILKEFDREAAFRVKVEQMKMLKGKKA